MRKLFLSAAIVLLFAGARVKARTIITEAGALSDELLPEDGCGIVDGAVDWNKPGRYPVMFEDGEAGEVIVASGDEFSGGFDIEKVYNRINLEESFDFFDVLFASEDEYYIYGAIRRDDFPYSPIYSEGFLYVAYYSENCLMWEHIVYPDRYGGFASACLAPGGIALIGDYDSRGEGRNVVICRYNNKGGLVYRREIHGSGNDFAHKIFYDEGIFRFVLSANSHDQDYDFRRGGDYDIICGYWRPETDEFRLAGFGNSGDEVCAGAAMSGGKLCVGAEFVGTGAFKNDGKTRFQGLVLVSPDLEIKGFAPLADGPAPLPVYSCGGDFFVMQKYYAQPYIDFHFYDGDLRFAVSRRVALPDGMRADDAKLYIRDEDIVIFAVGKIQSRDGLYLALAGKSFHRRVEKIFPVDDSPYIVGLYLTAAGEIVFAYLSGNKNVLYIKGLIRVGKESNVTDMEKMVVHSDDVYLNGRGIAKRETLFNATENILAPLGTYYNLERFVSDKYIVYLPVKLVYRPRFNVKNGEIYDVGYTLFFNGEGYLNNEPVRIGHAVAEPGNYILEIVGNGGERSSVFFSVAYLSEKEGDWIARRPTPALTCRYAPHPASFSNLPAINFEREQAEDNGGGGFYLVCAAVLIGLLAGGLAPVGKRGDDYA